MFKLNESYQFSTYTNPVIANSYKGVKLISILDYKRAMLFGNLDLQQRQIYPYLPPGTPSDHTKYTYLLFDNDGQKHVVAEEWVILNSVLKTEGMSKTIQLENVTSAQVALIRDQLRLLGISYSIL